MAYNGPRRSKSKFTSVRLTGLFRTKKRGLCVGTVNEEALEALIGKIKEAKKVDKGLTVFLWVNDKKDEDNQPYFTISVDVAQDRLVRGKAIEADPFAENDDIGNTKEDDPFS